MKPMSSLIMVIALAALLMLSAVDAASSQYTLMDASGGLRLKKIASSGVSTSEGVVSVISSPGTDSFLVSGGDDDVLAFDGDGLVCRGATLSGTSASERSALAITSVVSNAIVVDGITEGDVHAAGFGKNTRHARTLTALFRARLAFLEASSDAPSQQALILCVKSSSKESFDAVLVQEVKDLFEATAAEAKESKASFDDLYDVKVVSVTSKEEASEVSSIW